MNNTVVSILMGSESDFPVMKFCCETLKEFQVFYNVRVLSAHRTPYELNTYITSEENQGIKVFIAGAGGAAHLAGVIAAHTVLPVIGIPLAAGQLQGFDSLLSTVQMPKGIPVATVAVGKPGAINAAYLAMQIIGLERKDLLEKIREKRATVAAAIKEIRLEE
ncbi:5-(carboxyamino)imidazole ribonucleotide mutase [Chlamydiota bacterium]